MIDKHAVFADFDSAVGRAEGDMIYVDQFKLPVNEGLGSIIGEELQKAAEMPFELGADLVEAWVTVILGGLLPVEDEAVFLDLNQVSAVLANAPGTAQWRQETEPKLRDFACCALSLDDGGHRWSFLDARKVPSDMMRVASDLGTTQRLRAGKQDAAHDFHNRRPIKLHASANAHRHSILLM